MRGTVLNTATVAAGACIGLLVQAHLPQTYENVALEGLGLVVSLIGVRMFFDSKNAVIVVAAVALGGLMGAWIGIAPALDQLAEHLRKSLGGGGSFNEALVTTTVLYCVGPMTILGCLQDGIEGKVELLATKSVLDGISSVFFAATLGVGVLVTAAVLFLVQGTITLFARPLKSLVTDPGPISEASAAGGAMMLGIGLNLLGLKHLRMETYLPALVLAPVFSTLQARFSSAPGRLKTAKPQPVEVPCES